MVLKYFSPSFTKRRRKALTAILAWELGAGFTHIQNLFGVARHLRSIGVECVIATADPRFDSWFRSIGCQTIQTYLWPVMRSGVALPPQRKVHSFSDILANFGLCEPTNLAAMLAHYETLFALVQPDILLCDNALGASLSARGRIPTIILGSTLMFMPPRLGDRFAPIDGAKSEPSWPIEFVLDRLNSGLGSYAKPPLNALSDLLDCNTLMPFGPAAFDPYLEHRIDQVLSPYCPDLPKESSGRSRTTIFVYLHEDAQSIKPMMDTIQKLPTGSRVYIPSLSEAWQKRLLARSLIVEQHMLSLKEIAENAACLVHQGGVTLTAAALAMGIPQIILARSKENEIAGRYVAEKGLGQIFPMMDIATAILHQKIGEVLGDHKLRQKAISDSTLYRSWFKDDPTHLVAVKAAKILALPIPEALEPVDQRLWLPI
jgi:hypothetical protein